MGNFGTLELPAAASRYTEAKLSPFGNLMVKDLSKNIVPMVPNYDGTRTEPEFLPVPFPALLVNGSIGLGVGMAASIPSHNLKEVLEAFQYLLYAENPSTIELLKHFKGPDFNSGCDIVNQEDFAHNYSVGAGGFRLRAKFSFSGNQIIIKNFPYKTAAATVEEQIYSAQAKGELLWVRSVVNTTSKEESLLIQFGQKDKDSAIRELCRLTDCEKTFSLDFSVVLGSPRKISLLEYSLAWLAEHERILKRDFSQQLATVNEKLHILEGLKKAIILIDEIIAAIRASEDRTAAKISIVGMGLSERQASAVLDIKLSRLTKLEAVEIDKDISQLHTEKDRLEELLSNPQSFKKYIHTEFEKFKSFSTPRTSKIEQSVFPKIEKSKNTIFYVSVVKDKARISETKNGGIWIQGDSEHPVFLLHHNMITPIKTTKEPVIANAWTILETSTKYVYHLSEDGYIKKTAAKDLKTSRSAIAAKQDKVVSVLLSEQEQEERFVLLTLSNKKQVQFQVADMTATGRNSRGIIAVKLEEGEKVESAIWTKKVGGIVIGRNKKAK